MMEKIDMEQNDNEGFFAVRDGLTRSVPFEYFIDRADGGGDGLTLEGYAAVFNQATEINNYEGNFREVITRGAFRKTLREQRPVLQFDHGKHPMIGSLPIGKIERLREDEHGLHVRARLHTSELFEPVREAIASGAIDGMSFRFAVVRDEWTDGKTMPTRTINEVKLYELGPVVFPAYAATTVGVRDATDDDTSMGAEDDTTDGVAATIDAVPDAEPREHSDNQLIIVRQRRLALSMKGIRHES
jgi:HK97 family phage prohead protease